MHRRCRILFCAAALGAALPVQAAVLDVQSNGFAVEETVHIAAAPGKVYAALIAPAKWWNPEHSFSHSASNLSLDARAGGCFCETLPNGGSVRHATIVFARPNSILRLRGPFGPLQGLGVASALTFILKPAVAGGADLTLDNNVGGYMRGGFAEIAQAADTMLGGVAARLKRYCETGSASSPH